MDVGELFGKLIWSWYDHDLEKSFSVSMYVHLHMMLHGPAHYTQCCIITTAISFV